MARELVSVQEAGERLGVSVATVWRRIRKGELQSVRRGARRLVPAQALMRASSRRESAKIPAFSGEHPIFQLMGAGRGGGAAPGARDKRAVLGRTR